MVLQFDSLQKNMGTLVGSLIKEELVFFWDKLWSLKNPWAGYLARRKFVPRMATNLERLGASTFHSEVVEGGDERIAWLVNQMDQQGIRDYTTQLYM